MARALRLSFENTFYHITARGIRRDKIFYNSKDKNVFIDKMNETFEKYSFVCYAYCLMDNHYHLFIKTQFANISQGMHYLNTSYANWFKAKHRLVGSIFQGRYKSIVVDQDTYALVLSTYIHLNPLRAKMVDNLKDYTFSSYLDYISKRSPVVERLDTSLILDMLSNQYFQDFQDKHKMYEYYVMQNIDIENPLKKTYKNMALGSYKFIKNLKKDIEKIKTKLNTLTDKDREISYIKNEGYISKDNIIDVISNKFSINKEVIFEKRKNNLYRKLALYFLKRYSKLSLKEIGEIFDMDYSAVSQAVRRFERSFKTDKDLLKIKNDIEKSIKLYKIESEKYAIYNLKDPY